MLRLNEIKLPLNHDDDALGAAILNKLSIDAQQMLSFEVRGFGDFLMSFDVGRTPLWTIQFRISRATSILLSHQHLLRTLSPMSPR